MESRWPDPREEYQRRQFRCREQENGLEEASLRLSGARMAVFLAGVFLTAVLVARGWSGAWLMLPALVFTVLVFLHARLHRQLVRTRRGCTHYQKALDRLDGNAPSQSSGERWLDAGHPYAEHLDLFGPRSLYQLLCTARTLAGQETLARWLLHPASDSELQARPPAVDELRAECELREEMDRVGEGVASGLDPAILHAWASRGVDRPRAGDRWWAVLLAGSLLASLALWLVWGASPLPFLVFIGISWWFEQKKMRQGNALLISLEGVAGQLGSLARILEIIENYQYQSPWLRTLQEDLKGKSGSDPATPSEKIHGLQRRLEWLDSARNFFFAPAAFLLLWRMQCSWSLQAWMARHQPELDGWLVCAGNFEALVAVSAYAFEHPGDTWPRWQEARGLKGVGLGHPLLPASSGVRNDLLLDEELRLYLISGSNMSGKSTLLRTVGLNVVLAQAGAPVRARRLSLSRLAVGASLRIVDSLPGGISHFYAEVRRLRQLRQLSQQELPALLLLDEIFHGTNSHDRRIGAQALLRRFVDEGAFVLVTTHDLALTRLAEDLGSLACNVHFEDQVEEGQMVFDYRLRPGIAGKGNALRILAAEGLLDPEDLEPLA